MLGARTPTVLGRSHSGMVTGDHQSVVGYLSAVIQNDRRPWEELRHRNSGTPPSSAAARSARRSAGCSSSRATGSRASSPARRHPPVHRRSSSVARAPGRILRRSPHDVNLILIATPHGAVADVARALAQARTRLQGRCGLSCERHADGVGAGSGEGEGCDGLLVPSDPGLSRAPSRSKISSRMSGGSTTAWTARRRACVRHMRWPGH